MRSGEDTAIPHGIATFALLPPQAMVASGPQKPCLGHQDLDVCVPSGW